MKAIVKVLKLAPVNEKDDTVSISGYIVNEEKWEFRELSSDAQHALIDRLLEMAAEYVIKERSLHMFTLSEAETPGLRVMLGDGELPETSTVLTPKPSYLRRVLFVKCEETSNCKVVHVFRPSSQLIVYEGSMSIDSSLDYDFVILDCDDHIRVIFPYELSQSRVRQTTRKASKKRKKKKRHISSK